MRNRPILASLRTALIDLVDGTFAILHSGLAITGMVVLTIVITLFVSDDIFQKCEDYVLHFFTARRPPIENTAKRATAVNLDDLTPSQRKVTSWLATKYRVGEEPMGALVIQAHELSTETKLSPHLLLAVVAIESNFHPYIQSGAGAQGLMQVMKDVHKKRYAEYGGSLAAFDPVTNMQVGARILQDFIKLRGGSVDDGLKAYLGGLGLEDDGGYVAKVRAEEARLDRIASGSLVDKQ